MPGTTAQQLIQRLELQPHPEGGHFREVYRSADTADGRSVVTTIYFLLQAGEVSRWHKVDADEIWHFYAGAPLHLHYLSLDGTGYSTLPLSAPDHSHGDAVQVIPAHCWQAAESTGDYTLVGCTVAPGFEFSGFSFLSDDTDAATTLREKYADLSRFL